MESLAIIIAAAAGALVSWGSGHFILPLMHKLKFGQTINEIGPAWHKEKKQGIATMGGFMFIIGSVLGVLVGYPVLAWAATEMPAEVGLVVLGVFTSLAFSAIGFVDDWLKVVRQQNLGLRAWQKLLMQTLVAVCFLATLHMMDRLPTEVRLPFFAQPVEFGWLFYPISLVLMVGIVNAVNLTDGLDGLATSVTVCVFGGYLLLLLLFHKYSLALWAAALVGGCIGFLYWNFYPAKIIMGDTGSMYLGGAVVALGYCMGRPDVLIILSLVYIIEAASVMLQVSWFKFTRWRTGTGRRIFKMTPIHHHFEMMGWSEVKIDICFALAAVVCGIIAYVYAYVLG